MDNPEKCSKIYCLKSKNSNKVYVGSCQSSLALRKAQHKYSYKQSCKNGKNAYTSSIIYHDDPDPEMVLCELVDDLSQQRIREQFWIDKMKEGNFEVVNHSRSVYCYEHYKQKQKDRYHKNPEAQKKRCLNYYYKNKEAILAKSKAKRDKVKQDLKKLEEIEAITKNACQ